MTTPEINAFLAIRSIGVKDLAEAIEEDATAVSQVINYLRPGERIRGKIAAHFEMPVGEFFDLTIDCRPARFRQESVA